MATKTVHFEAKDKSAKAVQKKMDEIHESSHPNQVAMAATPEDSGQRDLSNVELRAPGVVDEQFPTNALGKQSKKDLVMTEKLRMANAQGVTPFGQLIATDEDFKWLRGKREQEEEAKFQQWFALNYDHMNPEGKAVARDLWPDFYAQRDHQLDDTIDLTGRIAKLKLHGIRNAKDLFLQYAIESGFIQADALNHIIHPEDAKAAQDRKSRQARYGRGLFNPRRLPTRSDGPQTRMQNAFDIHGRDTAASGATALYGTNYGGENHGFAAPFPESGIEGATGKGSESSSDWDREGWLKGIVN